MESGDGSDATDQNAAANYRGAAGPNEPVTAGKTLRLPEVVPEVPGMESGDGSDATDQNAAANYRGAAGPNEPVAAGKTRRLPEVVPEVPEMESGDGSDATDQNAAANYRGAAGPNEPVAAGKTRRLHTRQHRNRPCSSSVNTNEITSSPSDCSVEETSHDLRRGPARFGGKCQSTSQPTELSPATSHPVLRSIWQTLDASNVRNLSDSDGVLDLMSFKEDVDCELLDFSEEPGEDPTVERGLPSSNRFVVSLQKKDSKSNSTIGDEFLVDVRPLMANLRSPPTVTAVLTPHVQASTEEGSLIGSEAKLGASVSDKELSLLDVSDFIAESLADVKLWIHEVSPDCQKRIGT